MFIGLWISFGCAWVSDCEHQRQVHELDPGQGLDPACRPPPGGTPDDSGSTGVDSGTPVDDTGEDSGTGSDDTGEPTDTALPVPLTLKGTRGTADPDLVLYGQKPSDALGYAVEVVGDLPGRRRPRRAGCLRHLSGLTPGQCRWGLCRPRSGLAAGRKRRRGDRRARSPVLVLRGGCVPGHPPGGARRSGRRRPG